MQLTIYLPEELGEKVKQADTNVSAVCQAALSFHLDIIDNAEFLIRLQEIGAGGSSEPVAQAEFKRLKRKFKDLEERVVKLEAVDKSIAS